METERGWDICSSDPAEALIATLIALSQAKWADAKAREWLAKHIEARTMEEKERAFEQNALYEDLSETKRMLAKLVWQNISAQMTKELVASWAEEDRSRTYYFLLRLKPHDFKLSEEVMNVLSIKPISLTAMAWYKLAMMELGQPCEDAYKLPFGAGDWMSWKLGLTNRGTFPLGIWSQVP